MSSLTTPSPHNSQSPFFRHKSASPWRVTRFSPYLQRPPSSSASAPNPLGPRPPAFLLAPSTPNPLFQASTSSPQSLPQKVVRVTLPFSLRNNGRGRDINGDDEWDAILNLFPTLQSVSYDHPYLVVEVKELPPKPWPTFLADLPLWLTTTTDDLPFERGTDARAHLRFEVKGEIKEYENPDEATILEIFELLNGKGGDIDRIQWDGLQFFALGKTEPEAGWRDRLPSKVNGFRIGYVWASPSMDEHALRMKLPAANIKDDTEYGWNQLRPGVMVGGLTNDMSQRILTTSGVCVESPSTGKKFITVAAHGSPAGIGDAVYHPQARLNANNQLDYTNRIAIIERVFGNTDIALAELQYALPYSRETFSDHAPGTPNARPFRNFITPRDLRVGDTVFMNTPFNGQCEGCHTKFQYTKHWEATDTRPQERPTLVEIAHFSYWGNGTDIFFDGCCGGVIWNDDFDVIGQFRFQEEKGFKLAVSPSFDLLRQYGYQLSSI